MIFPFQNSTLIKGFEEVHYVEEMGVVEQILHCKGFMASPQEFKILNTKLQKPFWSSRLNRLNITIQNMKSKRRSIILEPQGMKQMRAG